MHGKSGQRGAALLALAAMLVLGASWMLLSAFGSASHSAARVAHNARVLAEAKAALIGWVATNALEAGEANPGRLPCPQAWGDVGSANEGRAAASCAAGAAGWLPWRTLGLPRALDAAGRPIWYVISPGWHLTGGGATLTINSNTPAQLSLDGRPAIALLIAPGAPLNSVPNAGQLAAGCAARNQSQALGLPTMAPNPRDFLECASGNAYAGAVVDNAANPVFNDQLLAITPADLLPALEAAIAKRIERDVVPALKGIYAGPEWGLSAANPVFPFAAPFANPGPGAGSSDFRGVAGVFAGLLPFNQTRNCTASPGNPRCLPAPALVTFAGSPDAYAGGGYGTVQAQSCSWPNWPTLDLRECTGEYHENDTYPWQIGMRIEMQATFTDVAMGLRVLDATRMTVEAKDDTSSGPWLAQAVTRSVTMNPSGAATITFGATLPNIDSMGWGSSANYRIRIHRAVIADHPLLDPASATTGWFVRNEWYRLLYYATSPNHAASGAAPRSCTPCLQVANLAPANAQRAILILAGRSLSGAARPNGLLADFLEGANADADPGFERRAVNASFNDRVVVLDANP